MKRLTKEEIDELYTGAIIEKGAIIRENVLIAKGAVIKKGAILREGAVIGAGAIIGKGTVIREGAVIRESAVIREGAIIGNGRKDVSECIVVNGIGSTKQMTGFICDDGIIVSIGCMNDWQGLPIEETRAEIKKKYLDENHCYYDALDLIQKFLTESEE